MGSPRDDNPDGDRDTLSSTRGPGQIELGVGPDDPPYCDIAAEEAESPSDSAGVIRSGKLAGKTMWAAIWILALPVLLQQLMQASVGLADKMLAGRLPGEMTRTGLDAIGVGSYVGWFIGIAMAGLGIGGQALIARAMGAGDLRQGHAALGQALALSFLWGLIVGALLWIGVGPIAWFTGLSPDATVLFGQYVRTIAAAMPLCGIMLVGSMCLHGAGETTLPSIIAIGVNVVNVIASWILSGVDFTIGETVIMNPFSFDLHVMGIAMGTAISYAFGAVATLWVLLRGVKDLQLEMGELRLSRGMMYRIVRVGVPNFLEGIAMWGVNLFILMFIGWMEVSQAVAGTAPGGLQGAHIIAVQWESFSFLPGFAIGIAAGALAGQYLGAGNPKMAQKAILTCTAIGATIMTSLGVLFILEGEFLTRLISSDPLHLEHTPHLLDICGAVQIFFAITMVVRQGLRGVGDTRWTLLITTVSSYGVRLPAAYLLGIHFDLGLTGIWFALCGEFTVRAMLFSARFLHGGWKGIQV